MFRIGGLRLPPFFFLSTSPSPPSLPQKKEKSESERLLTEQLQAKEWELLQLKTEMETSQGTGRAHRVNFLLYIIITSNTVFVLSNRSVCLYTTKAAIQQRVWFAVGPFIYLFFYICSV